MTSFVKSVLVDAPVERLSLSRASGCFPVVGARVSARSPSRPAGGKTLLTDRIEYERPGGLLASRLFGWIVTLATRNMFAHRHRVTPANAHCLARGTREPTKLTESARF
jgi:hypothetical protein